ncbi:MAG: CBS domain-containing protein [Desulfohalobiaceae bacterium]
MTASNGNVLSSVTVAEAMRRQVVRCDPEESIARCIARMVKYKTGAVLVEEEGGACLGVVSKTDVAGMYYVGVELDTRLGDIAGGEPLCCHPGDMLETALATMLDRGIRRVYVHDGERITGVVGYADIVGAMYHFCIQCRRNLYSSGKLRPEAEGWLTAQDVMHPYVMGCSASDVLQHALETLLEGRIGALAVFDDSGQKPVGVLSMSDAVVAYRHGVDQGISVERVMSAPVLTCEKSDSLTATLRTIIYADVQRIFVYDTRLDNLAGVLSLTDAARVRSGACKACRVASRL